MAEQVLTDDAVDFLTGLQREFGPRRDELLAARARTRTAAARRRAARLPAGDAGRPRRRLARRPAPADLQDRRVEITGPVDRKMVINALNSGARVFMADFEDANSPTWENCIEGQRQPDGRARPDDLARARREAVRAERRDRDAARAAARLAPGRAPLRGRRRADLGSPLRLRPLPLPQPRAPAAARPSSTCRSSSRTCEARLWNDVFMLRAGRSSASRAGRSRRPS